jgi:hypothetical protein
MRIPLGKGDPVNLTKSNREPVVETGNMLKERGGQGTEGHAIGQNPDYVELRRERRHR